jgi:hypothetical protein
MLEEERMAWEATQAMDAIQLHMKPAGGVYKARAQDWQTIAARNRQWIGAAGTAGAEYLHYLHMGLW